MATRKCKDCGVKWAQELGLCRMCANKRIGDKPVPFNNKGAKPSATGDQPGAGTSVAAVARNAE